MQKNIVVTGVNSGIGHEIAKNFLHEGWFVVGTSPLDNFVMDGVHIVKMDYLDEKGVENAVRDVSTLNKEIDLLINNASIQIDGEREDVDMKILRETMEVNLFGPIDFTEKLMPFLKEDESQIINISSFNASLSDFAEWNTLIPSYRISKTALNMYTKILDKRLRDKGVKVSVFDPGWVKTPMGGENAPRKPEEVASEIYDLYNSKSPSGKFWFKGEERSW